MGYLAFMTVFLLICAGISVLTGFVSTDRNVQEAGSSAGFLFSMLALFFSVLLVLSHVLA